MGMGIKTVNAKIGRTDRQTSESSTETLPHNVTVLLTPLAVTVTASSRLLPSLQPCLKLVPSRPPRLPRPNSSP